MLLNEAQDLLGILVRDKTECQLRHREAWKHRFGSFVLITATDAVEIDCRPRPQTLERAESYFAENRVGAALVQDRFVCVDRQFLPSFAFPIGDRLDIIVNPGTATRPSRSCSVASIIGRAR